MFIRLFLIYCLHLNVLFADDKLVGFLKENVRNLNLTTLFEDYSQDPDIDISVVKRMKLEKPKGWSAYLIEYKSTQKREYETFYINKGVLTNRLFDIEAGKEIDNPIENTLRFNPKYYDDEHLISGDRDAKHRFVIFSDPLCTSCRKYVPEVVSYMKKYPKIFRVYHYYFPLYAMHSASAPLIKSAIAAKMKGEKNVFSSLYKIDLEVNELDLIKITNTFNAANGTKIGIFDILDPKVQKHLKHDQYVAEEHLVVTTPTVFLDGKKDPTKTLYKSIKLTAK